MLRTMVYLRRTKTIFNYNYRPSCLQYGPNHFLFIAFYLRAIFAYLLAGVFSSKGSRKSESLYVMFHICMTYNWTIKIVIRYLLTEYYTFKIQLLSDFLKKLIFFFFIFVIYNRIWRLVYEATSLYKFFKFYFFFW